MKAMSLSVKTMKTRHSGDIAQIFEETAMQLGGNPQAQAAASMMAGGMQGNQSPMSQKLKLPQNTNEGL